LAIGQLTSLLPSFKGILVQWDAEAVGHQKKTDHERICPDPGIQSADCLSYFTKNWIFVVGMSPTI